MNSTQVLSPSEFEFCLCPVRYQNQSAACTAGRLELQLYAPRTCYYNFKSAHYLHYI